jgi:lactase-phlorizin hydrolase
MNVQSACALKAQYMPCIKKSGHLYATIISTFQLGLYARPVFSQEGDYPQLVKERIANKSAEEGFLKSRLPKFTEEEIAYVRGKVNGKANPVTGRVKRRDSHIS